MVGSSLYGPGGVAEYGFLTDTTSGVIGPLFSSGHIDRISGHAVRGTTGAPILHIPGSSSRDQLYTHFHPGRTPSQISPGDRTNADYYGWTIAMVDSAFNMDCY